MFHRHDLLSLFLSLGNWLDQLDIIELRSGERQAKVVLAASEWRKHRVSFGVAGNLRLCIPSERRALFLAATEFHAHAAERAERRRLVRPLGIADRVLRILAGNRLEPVLEVMVGREEFLVTMGQRVINDLARSQICEERGLRRGDRTKLPGRNRRLGVAQRHLDGAARAPEPVAFLAAELDAHLELVVDMDVSSAAVVVKVVFRVNVPKLCARKIHPFAGSAHGRGIAAEPPCRDVKMMGAPIRDHSPAVWGELNPARAVADAREDCVVTTSPVIGYRRVRRTEPRVVIKARGDGLRRAVAAGLVAADADFDTGDLAETPVADELDDLAELRTGTLPRADLDDKSLHRRDVGDNATFLNRLGERLLQVNVLAREEAVRRNDRMLVVGYADEDGVNGRIEEQLLVILVRLDRLDDALLGILLLDHLLAVFGADEVVVGDGGDDAPLRELLHARHVHRVRNAPVANDTDVDLAVHDEFRRTAVYEGKGAGGQRRQHKGTPRNINFHFCIIASERKYSSMNFSTGQNLNTRVSSRHGKFRLRTETLRPDGPTSRPWLAGWHSPPQIHHGNELVLAHAWPNPVLVLHPRRIQLRIQKPSARRSDRRTLHRHSNKHGASSARGDRTCRTPNRVFDFGGKRKGKAIAVLVCRRPYACRRPLARHLHPCSLHARACGQLPRARQPRFARDGTRRRRSRARSDARLSHPASVRDTPTHVTATARRRTTDGRSRHLAQKSCRRRHPDGATGLLYGVFAIPAVRALQEGDWAFACRLAGALSHQDGMPYAQDLRCAGF